MFHYLKALSKHVNHGNIDVVLGEYYLKKYEWGRALYHFSLAVEKGNLKSPTRVHALVYQSQSKLGGMVRGHL